MVLNERLATYVDIPMFMMYSTACSFNQPTEITRLHFALVGSVVDPDPQRAETFGWFRIHNYFTESESVLDLGQRWLQNQRLFENVKIFNY